LPNDGNWHKFNATTSGEGTVYPNFPVGTKYVRVLILANYSSVGGETTLIDHISVRKINNGALYVGHDATSTNQVNQTQVSKLFTDGSNHLNLQTNSNGNIVINANGTGILDVQDNADFAGTLTAGTANAFTVSAAGAIVGVGVNSGTGLIQGTGGATLSGNW
jgi:hypothetical protein